MVTSSGVDDEGGGRDGSGPRGSGRPWDGRTSQRRDRDHVAPPRPRAAAIGTGPVTARVDATPEPSGILRGRPRIVNWANAHVTGSARGWCLLTRAASGGAARPVRG